MTPAKKPDPRVYEARKNALSFLEGVNRGDSVEVYYADATKISASGHVPYAWQFKGERVEIPVQKGFSTNCFGFFSRKNEFIFTNVKQNIKAQFVHDRLEELSFKTVRPTVVVLDNASVHRSKKVLERIEIWEKRNLYLFWLPPYSPQLNIIERLWAEIKGRWLKPSDYRTPDHLFYAVDRICNNVGKELRINFGPCSF